MGFRVAWIACKDWKVDDVVARSRWEATTERDTGLNVGVFAASVPGWAILAGHGTDYFGLVDWDDAVALSRETEVVYFATNDTSMVSGVSFLVDGEVRWSVHCVATEGPARAQISGDPPANIRSMVAATSDGYDVAARIGQALVGIRHDGDLDVVLLHR